MRFKNRGNVAGTTDDFHERMVKQVSGTEACLRMYKRRVCVYRENIGKAVSVESPLRNVVICIIYHKLNEWMTDVFLQAKWLINIICE